jgi:poly-gamma-glutamate capsule biosynthesis protein CapA/YwtB (metallophosphatase superfamily)
MKLLALLSLVILAVQSAHPSRRIDHVRAKSFQKYQRLFTVGDQNDKHYCKTKDIRIVLCGQAWIKFPASVTNLSFENVGDFINVLDALSPTVLFSNLETAINGTYAISQNATLVNFAAPHVAEAGVIDVLQHNYSVNVISTSNNHFADIGPAGTISGIQELALRHLKNTGAGLNANEAVTPTFLQHKTNNKQVGIMGVVGAKQDRNAVGWIANETFPGVNGLEMLDPNHPNPNKVAFELAAVRALCQSADIEMFYHHNHWYSSDVAVDQWVKDFAHSVVDNGASIYLGQGSEAIRGIEIYKGNLVLYGNGNLFFEGQVRDPDYYREGLVFDLCYDGKTTQLLRARAIPTFLTAGLGNPWSQEWNETHGLPTLSSGAQANATLQNLKALSAVFGTVIEVDEVEGVGNIVLQPYVPHDPSLACKRDADLTHHDNGHNDEEGDDEDGGDGGD